MKPTDVIALLIGAIALTSLLRGDPEGSTTSEGTGFFSTLARAAQPPSERDDHLRSLCEEQRATTLKILMAIVEAGSEEGESRNETIDRLNSNQREMLSALRKYTELPIAKVNKAESEDIRQRIGTRPCPEMSRAEQQRFLAEALRYNPALLKAGKQFYPQIFGDAGQG